MVNLLSNSLKFTFRGSITVSLDYNEEIEELKVTVSDTGIGIKDEDRELILEMFTRHDTPIISTNTNGPGLELSISSQLVRALGGRIEIEKNNKESLKAKSKAGSGTSISFSFKALPVFASINPNTI